LNMAAPTTEGAKIAAAVTQAGRTGLDRRG
jgi:hypothetical protein